VEGGVEEQRQRLLATLADWAIGTARAQPMVIAFEDLHWSDPSSLELQKVLVEQTATAPIMLVYTARPEFRASWPMRAHHAQITLNRLSKRQVKEMVARVSVRAALADNIVGTLVERTGGVPLFIEELTRLVIESGSQSIAHQIPDTLHDSLRHA